MRKILKVSGVVLGVLVLLLVIAAVVVPLLVDPNDFKPRIISAVENATGRTLEIPGEINLSVFPWLGVDLGAVRLGNARGFGDAPFASVEGVQVRVKLLPLLRREIEIGRVVIEQPVIRLAKNAQGRSNWEDLAEEPATSDASAADPEAAETTPPEFSVDGVEINDARITYTDAVTGMDADLTGFDLATGHLGLPAEFPLTMSGTARLSDPELVATFEFQGQISAAPDRERYAVTNGKLIVDATGKTLPVSPLTGELSWQHIAAEMSDGIAEVQGLALNILGVSVTGAISASNLEKTPDIKGELRIAEFSPGQLLVKLGQKLPETRDGEVLDKAALAARFQATPDSVVIEDIRGVLDQSNITGRIAVTSFSKPAARFNVAVDQLDVDRYLPPPAEKAEEADAETSLDEIEIPADLVRGHDVVGELVIGKLKAFGFNSTDVKVGVTAQNDRLRVHPVRAKFYGGGYSGDLRLDASGDVPVISADEHVERVQLAPMVKDVLEVDNVSGTAKIDVAATARGPTVGALRKTLNGSFGVDVRNGAIEGFNLWESIREAYATFKRRDYESNAPERTEFAELSASGKITQGTLRNNDLVAKLPFLRIAGQGEIDIAAATMDYTVEATVLKSPELTGEIEELADAAIPVRISGSVLDPKIRPDVKGVLEAKARAALKRKEQQLREEAERKEQQLRDEAKQKAEEEKQRLEEKLKDKLKDFLG